MQQLEGLRQAGHEEDIFVLWKGQENTGPSTLTEQDRPDLPTASAKPKAGTCRCLSQLEKSQLRSQCCQNTLASFVNSTKSKSLLAPDDSGQTAPNNLVSLDGAQFHHGDMLT